MGRFDISPEVAAEYRHKFRDAVQPHVDEEVLAVGTFRTTGSGTNYAISKTQAGALAYGAAGLIGRKRAGGLPGQFLLAVETKRLQTTTRVTLTMGDGDQLVVDQDGMGDNPWADDVVRELQDPAAR